MRNMYHSEGATDLDKMRQDARKSAEQGEVTTIHHHGYGAPCELELLLVQKHEVIKPEEPEEPKEEYPEEDES
jgi:hypothetical protein